MIVQTKGVAGTSVFDRCYKGAMLLTVLLADIYCSAGGTPVKRHHQVKQICPRPKNKYLLPVVLLFHK